MRNHDRTKKAAAPTSDFSVNAMYRFFNQEITMAIDTTLLEDFNSQAKRAVEQTKEQVLGAVDNYFNFLQKTISSYPTGGTELGEKIKSYAEKNIAATHEFLRKVGQA